MPKKNKKTPLRKCLVSNEMFAKDALIRIVKTKENDVFVDVTGKKNGRGYYVCASSEVILKAKKAHVLERHLKTADLSDIYDKLLKVVNGEHIG